MPETRGAGQEIQSDILEAIRKSQEAVVDAIKRWADTVQSIMPTIPTPNLPYSDKVPKPEDLMASAYNFTEELLDRPAEVRGGPARGSQAAAWRRGRPGGQEGRHQVAPSMRGGPGFPAPPRIGTLTFTALPLPGARCQIPGTRGWKPWELSSAPGASSPTCRCASSRI